MMAHEEKEMYILIADSRCCIAEAKQHCKTIIFQLKYKFKKLEKNKIDDGEWNMLILQLIFLLVYK